MLLHGERDNFYHLSLTLFSLLASLSLGFADTRSCRRGLIPDQELLLDSRDVLHFSSTWQVLGPFRIGTRESAWGADPLEALGGFRSLQYDPIAQFRTSLAANGTVRWSTLSASDSSTREDRAKVTIDVSFADIDWQFIQSVYGWPALQYQAWARGHLQVPDLGPDPVALFTDGILELWVDGYQYFGGDFYTYRRSPIILDLQPGSHTVDVRLIRDVRAHGGLGSPRITVSLEAQRAIERLAVDAGSLLVSDVVDGRIASPLASVNVRNNMAEWVDVIGIRSAGPTDNKFTMNKGHLGIAPSQSRPLILNATTVDPSTLTFSIEIAYRPEFEDAVYWTSPVTINLISRTIQEPQKFTFLHPSGVVSYAVIRPPPPNETCGSTGGQLPVLLNLHGAGLETDSDQVRHTLDDAYGVCAWILFPSGVTPWSGDDYHTWGAADVQAAVAAIPTWIRSVGWTGSGVSQEKWLVSGHSNGGQGTWFLITHHPDKVIAAAPVSGYSSIDNYVPFTMWRESEPLLRSNLQNALSSFKHELLVDNLAGIPILQQHGSRDDNVPPYHSRLLADLISEAGWASDYHELPGKGHWFEGVMTTPSLISFYEEFLGEAKHPVLPEEFSIVVPTSGDMGSKGWIAVDQLQSPDVYGHVRVVRSAGDGVWYLKTRNIHRFHLARPGPEIPTPFPSTLIVDGVRHPLPRGAEWLGRTWFVKVGEGLWQVSTDDGWRGLSQRYGRQMGSLDAFLRTPGPFRIRSCSPVVDEVALQISRNLFQYLGADSEMARGGVCAEEEHGEGVGNVVTVAVGKDLPPSRLRAFPIRVEEDRLSLWTRCGGGGGGEGTRGDSPSELCEHHYGFNEGEGMGAVFLRPVEGERVELVVWGVDEVGVRQAARLLPILTGVGQPDFVVVGGSCRWKGHAGALAAGFLDRSWQISAASYVR
ncbi:hypothetical protein FQN54_007693 [Arachnomyces sp. PD_36]|nr:hypothetical protein FQN54_007693 [Arachnomyces sp. PD_36]